jgi:putative ABC transport system permease protein
MTIFTAQLAVARATLGGAFGRERGRLLLATLAIALGIALGFAIDLVNRTAIAEFASGMATLSGNADLEVRGPRAGFDENVYPLIAQTDGVAVASPVVEIQGRLPGFDDTLPIFGVDAFRAARVTPALLGVAKSSIELLDPDTIFVSPVALEHFGVNVGAMLTLQSGMSNVVVRVAGMTADSGRERYAVMDIAAVQNQFGRSGTLTRIDVRLAPGVDATTAARRIGEKLPPGVVAAPPAVAVGATSRLSRAYRINLNVLALVALFTGALLVFSTQALAVARRRSQFALLRTLGVTRRRLLLLVIGEGAMIGAIGAAIGLPVGYLLAQFAVEYFGGDLGAGFFRGVPPQLHVRVKVALVFVALGIGAAMAGSAIPALDAARAAPAAALKSEQGTLSFARLRSVIPGAVFFAAGALATLAPPVADLPLFGYGAIALLLIGTLFLLSRAVAALLTLAPRPHNVASALALDQLRGAPGQAIVSLSAIVASVALMVSMAIMVASFRQSLDDWLSRVLPADVYVRAGVAGDGASFDAVAQHRIAELPGVRRAMFSRSQSILLDASLPRVALIARTLDDPTQLPLTGAPASVKPGDPPPIWATEPMHDLYGFTPGRRVTIPLAGKQVEFTVAGIWRDYARQQGALLIDRNLYIAVTGDHGANDASLWLASGVSIDDVRHALDAAIGADRATITTAGELRRISLRVFDRTFAVTYALEAAAVAIGLTGMASSFGALALARRREFGMLRHLGMTRRQIGAMLATQGATVSAIGLIVGLILGGIISLILIHVVNRQSFHWSMDLSVPWSGLALFSVALLALAVVTTLVAAREAMSEDAVRVVKDDW